MTDHIKVEKETRFIITLYSGDIYILTGYNSAEEIDQKLSLTEKSRMPNGDIIKVSSIEKIQSYDSYRFQKDQKERHKRGQYIKGGKWWDVQGEVTNAYLESITGKMTAIEAPKTSPQSHQLPKG